MAQQPARYRVVQHPAIEKGGGLPPFIHNDVRSTPNARKERAFVYPAIEDNRIGRGERI